MIISLLFSQPLFFIAWVLAIALALSVHECSHALAAYWQGDPTAKNKGRLTLNPLAHLDPIGTLMLLIVGFGWGKPVPFNPYNLKNQRYGPAVVSIAGPAANLIMAGIAGLVLRILLAYTSLGLDNLGIAFLVLLIFINLILMFFNLIPIPPLDGSKILFALLPASTINFQMKLERSGPLLILALIILDRILPVSIFGVLLLGVVAKIGNLFVPNFIVLLSLIFG